MFTIDTNHIVIDEIVVFRDKITVKGLLISSNESFVSSRLTQKEGMVFIKSKGRLSYSFIKSNDKINLESAGDFSDVTKVYLSDKHKNRLIWNKKSD